MPFRMLVNKTRLTPMHLLLSYLKAEAKMAELTPDDIRRFTRLGYVCTPTTEKAEDLRPRVERMGFLWVEQPE